MNNSQIKRINEFLQKIFIQDMDERKIGKNYSLQVDRIKIVDSRGEKNGNTIIIYTERTEKKS